MGIQGLLPLLKSIQQPTHLRKFAGQTIGVDAYGWLHRGTVACAIDLAQSKPTRRHIDFALNRVRMLIHFGVKPYLVFDGDYLPSKAHTEHERATRRSESKKLGLELLAKGRTNHAQLELQKAVDVTPSMARQLIEELKILGVPYVVAPYEADAQLAYLEKQGVISGVLSEDSDLLVFGVRCLLTKLDQFGECVMINRSNFTACREVSLVGWTDAEFRMMAMLSGCDYLPGIDKMGLKTAYRLVRKQKTVERIVRTIQFDGKMKVPADYLNSFARAERTFLHQWVYDADSKELVNLNPVPVHLNLNEMPYIGAFVDSKQAEGVARGNLDPNTKEPLKFESKDLFNTTRRVQTPNEKQGKPISEFFKPKRTPLAELDPNSFAASPSQQRLQENQLRMSWPAAQVPSLMSQSFDRSISRPAPSSAPQPTRRIVSTPANATQSGPAKRQRLCSDASMASHMGGSLGINSVTTSPFFAKPDAQASPSLRKATTHRERVRNEFDLWSDDSTSEAIAALATEETDAVSCHKPGSKKRKKVAVFADPDPSRPGAVEQADANAKNVAQDFDDGATPSRADRANEVCKLESVQVKSIETASVFSRGVNARFEELKAKFEFNCVSSPKSPLRTHSAPHAHRAPLQQSDSNELIKQRPLTSAMKPAAEVDIVEVVASSPPAVLEYSVTGVNAAAVEESDDDTTAWKSAIVNALSEVKGSEDLQVPDSPNSRSDHEESASSTLSLGRFAYCG